MEYIVLKATVVFDRLLSSTWIIRLLSSTWIIIFVIFLFLLLISALNKLQNLYKYRTYF